MKNFENLVIGKLDLIQQTEDGTIKQIELTVEQSEQLQVYAALISKDNPLIIMGDEYNLTLKSGE